MPWKDWENPRTAGYHETRSFLGISRERDVSDSDIDRAIRQGRNPRSVFARKISRMSRADQKKVERRIAARQNKNKQGKQVR